MRAFYQYSIRRALAGVAALLEHRRDRRQGDNPTQESFASRLSHVIPLALGAGVVGSAACARPWLAARFLPRRRGLVLLGFVLVALGLAFAVAARIWLGGNWSSIVTLKQDHELIRSGPYRWVRHPIYTGLLLAVLVRRSPGRMARA